MDSVFAPSSMSSSSVSTSPLHSLTHSLYIVCSHSDYKGEVLQGLFNRDGLINHIKMVLTSPKVKKDCYGTITLLLYVYPGTVNRLIDEDEGSSYGAFVIKFDSESQTYSTCIGKEDEDVETFVNKSLETIVDRWLTFRFGA